MNIFIQTQLFFCLGWGWIESEQQQERMQVARHVVAGVGVDRTTAGGLCRVGRMDGWMEI